MTSSAILIDRVSHRYGSHEALREISLTVNAGEIFVFLGPNGGGKTTLFRLLSTLIPLQNGAIEILSRTLPRDAFEIRRRIGVVFQAPSLDKKLTVLENIRHQAALYGLFGAELKCRQEEMMEQLGLADRANERAETLSGGLRRRVELAKGMIHRPELLLLDEPSTGLDPGARSALWDYLHRLRSEFGVTIALTTHLLEEAERADRIGILHEGKFVAVDTPAALKASVGGDSITISTEHPEQLCREIEAEFQLTSQVIDESVRLEQADGHHWIPKLMEAFPGKISAIRLGKPTLEDVFIDRTGSRFWGAESGGATS